jgi:hypothetical protein
MSEHCPGCRNSDPTPQGVDPLGVMKTMTVVQLDERQNLMLIICQATLAMVFPGGRGMTKQERDRELKRAQRAQRVIEEAFGGTEITQISMDDINSLSEEDLAALYSRLPKRGPWLTRRATQ